MPSRPPNDEPSLPADSEVERLLWAEESDATGRADDADSAEPGRFQFSIGSMLVLTTVCAVLLALGAMLELPLVFRSLLGLPISIRVSIACFLLLFVVYAVLRLPWIISRLRRAGVRRREIRREREQLVRSLTRTAATRRDFPDDGPDDDEAVT